MNIHTIPFYVATQLIKIIGGGTRVTHKFITPSVIVKKYFSNYRWKIHHLQKILKHSAILIASKYSFDPSNSNTYHAWASSWKLYALTYIILVEMSKHTEINISHHRKHSKSITSSKKTKWCHITTSEVVHNFMLEFLSNLKDGLLQFWFNHILYCLEYLVRVGFHCAI